MAKTKLIRVDGLFIKVLDGFRRVLKEEGHNGSYSEATELLAIHVKDLDREFARQVLEVRRNLIRAGVLVEREEKPRGKRKRGRGVTRSPSGMASTMPPEG